MIKDITGIELIPGNFGMDCPGNGERGNECCCDECDYLQCCVAENYPKLCADCNDKVCPRHNTLIKQNRKL